jgi:four helix bundle protein
MVAHGEPKGQIRSYQDLIAWQKAMKLAEEIYRATSDFPKEETFGLKVQMRRAAVSVASNIAEGHARSTAGEFVQFLGHAKGSLAELETQTILSHRLELLGDDFHTQLADAIAEVGRLLNGLRNSLR